MLERGVLSFAHGTHVEWLRLGRGSRLVLIVPTASDGLWTTPYATLRAAWTYRHRLRSYRLLLISRRQPIPRGFQVRQHAEDYIHAIEHIGWGPSVWECVSAGGPIGQWVAATRPDLVQGLVLTSTMHRVDKRARSVLELWKCLATDHRWTELYRSLLMLNKPTRRNQRMEPLLAFTSVLPRPRDPTRFVHLIDGLLVVDHSSVLPRIMTPCLVVGGQLDQIFGASLQREMADLLPNGQLILYEGYGHAVSLEHRAYELDMRHFVDGLGRDQGQPVPPS